MRTYTPAELKDVLARHAKWITGETGGEIADLRGADLRGADLRGADLRGADLGSANLWSANLRGANLGGADLRGANLQGANLGDANLGDANLWSANLRDANLGGADLRGANLQGANLQGAHLEDAKWDDATHWPAITAVLLASWGKVSDELCRDLMRYDAVCYPDPTAFDRWAKGGPCPYDNVHIGRAAYFVQKKELWAPGNVRPYDIFQRLLAEKLVKVP
jgi:pentapeptide repeat protein